MKVNWVVSGIELLGRYAWITIFLLKHVQCKRVSILVVLLHSPSIALQTV